MALRNACTRAGLLRAAAGVTSRGLLTGEGLVVHRVGPAAAGLQAQPASARGFSTSVVAGQTRNLVEDEIYDRSRQEIVLGPRVPCVAGDAWVAPNATLIGDTDLADRTTVWHGAVLKGDLGAIRVGAFSNVMEKAVIDAPG